MQDPIGAPAGQSYSGLRSVPLWLRSSIASVILGVAVVVVSGVALGVMARLLSIRVSVDRPLTLAAAVVPLAILLNPLWMYVQRALEDCLSRRDSDSTDKRRATFSTSLENRTEKAEVLHWIGQAVNFAMDSDDLMELIYAQTCRVLDTENFCIALLDAEMYSLSLAFCVISGERVQCDTVWPLGAVLCGQVVMRNQPIVTCDYVAECRLHGIEPSDKNCRAWMGIPLNGTDRLIGVMIISSSDQATYYSEDDLRLITLIADQASAILDKAQLYQEMEERNRQLAVLNEFGGQLPQHWTCARCSI
ncbi:MAG: GAF domain-containing protein [Chloroflexi bacterium]|nr:GAF domain-containing protein [Chloroflexota bacterium]